MKQLFGNAQILSYLRQRKRMVSKIQAGGVVVVKASAPHVSFGLLVSSGMTHAVPLICPHSLREGRIK